MPFGPPAKPRTAGCREKPRSIWLAYHDVYRTEPAHGIPRSAGIYHVSKESFLRHMSAIRDAGRPVVTISEYLAGVAADSLVLTFDDGWSGAFENALPILQEVGWKATFFVTRDFVGRDRFCNKRMLVDAVEAGMEIGIHGTTHRMLSRCSAAELVWEFAACKNYLESLLGRSVQHASLPGGDWSPGVESCAIQAGFKSVCTSVPGFNILDASPFQLKRMAIKSGTRCSDIDRYCGYSCDREIWRWAFLQIPRRVLGVRNYVRLRKWIVDERDDNQSALFEP
jgi:peptidoglycan/xylan/chitin deacetylase (PgdA/CDA1 family)